MGNVWTAALASVLLLSGVVADRSAPKESAARAVAVVVIGLGVILFAVYCGMALAG